MPATAQQRYRHSVISALLAGLISGVLLTVAQMFTTSPLIAKAEMYENSATPAPTTTTADGHAAHNHDATWEPADALERTFYSGVSNVLLAIGYGLLLAAMLSSMNLSGWRHGLMLGAAGYIVFQLAPAFGLPPHPPGVAQAALAGRQTWWFGTVIATALGLAALYRARGHDWRIWIPLGVALLIIPHVIGAPSAPQAQSVLPSGLAQQFAVVALLTSAMFWLMLGAIEGLVFTWLARRK